MEFFRNGKLLKELNATIITLVPKIPEAINLGDFRPISCCNFLYKVISKIIANRLQLLLPWLISGNQAAFQKGRSMGDHIMLAAELVKDYNRPSAEPSAMLKIDIKKAFDSISWDFILDILRALDLPLVFIGWIRECITSPSFSVAINGELAGFFRGKRVIYGMVNAWSRVFMLPKHLLKEIDRLCSTFLWKNSIEVRSKARIAWKLVCQPKEEGGLGIRRLEDFSSIFRLKSIWMIFKESGSLWVAWLKENVFKKRGFWGALRSQRQSCHLRKLLGYKDHAREFLSCVLGNGKTTTFWHDDWTGMGPLIERIGAAGPRALRIPLYAAVAKAVRGSNWNFPGARSSAVQVVLSTLQKKYEIPTDFSNGLIRCNFSNGFPTVYRWNNSNAFLTDFQRTSNGFVR
uniref:Reverse transcriptase domain-containing protein n=1 Tax=Tarenaya spinosa TaxID=228870 RepID=Q1KUP4_9ROSI|nr:hypothetical protein [Tarenaya spinosa]